MGARLKVYGTVLVLTPQARAAYLPDLPAHRAQCRGIVATTSAKAAAEAFGVTPSAFRTWGCETGNAGEIEAAMAKPGTVFIASLDGAHTAADYVEVPPST